eukprot:TRINITY_DN13956_c0_g1_i1.p1 TRINITY_DN13956_c0_g1~~TRINITY_DN13956_c0_g1_i1.p1  ORF type:complete len:523 (+),score=108.32 TRINITY_DN13956_c0_g1_i1:72-1640(+)
MAPKGSRAGLREREKDAKKGEQQETVKKKKPPAGPFQGHFAAKTAVLMSVTASAVAVAYWLRASKRMLLNPNTPDVVAQQELVRKLRKELETRESSNARSELAEALDALYAMPAYKTVGSLNTSRHRYGTDRLVADAGTITEYQRGMLLHDKPVQILDMPSMELPTPKVEGSWAIYNPSAVPIDWRGQRHFLVSYRLSTWNLCTWNARGSPLERLPEVDGAKRVTSKVGMAILDSSYQVRLPLHDLEGQDYEEHYCTHHTGMVRMGADDGRLLLLKGEPWLLFAVVAPKGHTEYCFHHMMLCPLEVPETADGVVKCKRSLPLQFDEADAISESHRKAGRLPNVHQKNWVPFVADDNLYLVFTIEPFVVLKVDLETGRCTQQSKSKTSAFKVFQAASKGDGHSTMGVHGGSPFLQLPVAVSKEQEFLAIGRIARGNTQYSLLFYTIAADDDGFKIRRVSPIFCFGSSSPSHQGLCETIQFAGGLMLDAFGNLVVTYGTNDCEAKIAFLPLERVQKMLLPAKSR